MGTEWVLWPTVLQYRGEILLHENKGLVINYGEGKGVLIGKIVGLKLFEPPLPSRQDKTFDGHPFKEWKLVMPPALSIWPKLQATS